MHFMHIFFQSVDLKRPPQDSSVSQHGQDSNLETKGGKWNNLLLITTNVTVYASVFHWQIMPNCPLWKRSLKALTVASKHNIKILLSRIENVRASFNSVYMLLPPVHAPHV